jgi:hypothetical protein
MGISFSSSHALSFTLPVRFSERVSSWVSPSPVLMPFHILIDPVLTSKRTGGQVIIAGITFQVLIPFHTLVEPVLTSRELAVRFS